MKFIDKRQPKVVTFGPRGGRYEDWMKVEVRNRDCLYRKCYYPMEHKGSYRQGRGYSGAQSGRFICGTRDAGGCPFPADCPVRRGAGGEACDSCRENPCFARVSLSD